MPVPTLYDDVYRWAFSRVPAQSGTVSAASITKNNALVTALFQFGLRSKITRLQTYAGSFAALGAPLIKDFGAGNDGINGFVSGDYSETTGLTGGTSKYIGTGFNPSSIPNTNSWHMGAYVRTGSDASTHLMGVQTGVGDTALLVSFAGTSYWDSWNSSTGRCSTADSAGTGLYIGTRTTSSASNLYKNGTSIASTAGAVGTPPNADLVVHAFNDSGASGIISFTARTVALYTMGSGLSATDVANYYKAVQAYQTAMGRQV